MDTMGEKSWSLKSDLVLNDGITMPLFGLGVYLAEGETCANSVYHALQHGYRMIDTAEFYGNEEFVGKAVNKFLEETGTPREKIFVVTKLSKHRGAAECRRTFNEQIEKLNIGYVDLYLMHSPLGGKIIETYAEMVKLKETGKVRSVGVSNFGVQHLEPLAAAGLPLPSVNQIELHAWQHKEALVKYCQDKGIAVMGYSPLAKGNKVDEPEITQLAERYGKTNAQILIRYSVQMNFITIPKSAQAKRIEENADVFDFELDDADMHMLNSLPEWSCTNGWDPSVKEWTD